MLDAARFHLTHVIAARFPPLPRYFGVTYTRDISPLTTRKRTQPVFPVTHPGHIELGEFHAVLFAMRFGNPALSDLLVLELSFGELANEYKKDLPFAVELRERTQRELDALASHQPRRQAAVLTRVIEDGRLSTLEGTAHIGLSRRQLRFEWTPIIQTFEQLVDYGLALLLDDSMPWGRRLFRCHLEECRKFFLAKPPKRQGQFRYKYCCVEHQRAADAKKGAERVRRFREKHQLRKPK